MKKYLSIMLSVMLVLISCSACGLTVTEVENSTSTESESATVAEALSSVQSTETTESTATTQAGESTAISKTSATTTSGATSASVTSSATEKNQILCTIEISCKTVLSNMSDLEPAKKDYVPQNGEILAETTVAVDSGSSAFDVLKTVCNKNKIQLEYKFTPAYNSYYVEGINQLYEFDCGDNSGWMYSVNGVFPNKGSNMYTVQNGDKIKFLYTCDLGSDLNASF